MSEWGTMMPVNARVEQKWVTPPSFPVSFSMSQQGFSADVTCQQQNLDTTTVPSLTLLSTNQTLFNSTITLAQLKTLCPNSTDPDFSGAFLYDHIFIFRSDCSEYINV
jgi:hypothetical protein